MKLDEPKARPGPGQAVVQVKAFGLNRMDIMQREGVYPPVPHIPTRVLGVEFSGIVESLGEGDTHGFKKGDEVFGLAYGGICS